MRILIICNLNDQLLITSLQLKAVYMAIEEYKTMGSGGTWDDEKGANIDVKNPDSIKFWEGYVSVSFSQLFTVRRS